MSKSVSFGVIPVVQPIGTFYIASLPWTVVRDITYNDVRRIQDQDSDLDRYTGIQRKVGEKRRKELVKFVNTVDATFPTSLILALKEQCVSVEDDEMTLLEFPGDAEEEAVPFDHIALVIDGQHRIAGLKDFSGETPFDINVSLFIGLDLSDEAYLFSTVNLAQTKVNKSLAYDLYDYATSRSPIKTCHQIAVTLNGSPKSPFHRRIKRLGPRTPGLSTETMSQATFVNALQPLITKDSMGDRDLIKRRAFLSDLSAMESQKMPLRSLFVRGEDAIITGIVSNFFHAVAEKWPKSWYSNDRGQVLSRANGVRALMRVLREFLNALNRPDGVVKTHEFARLLAPVEIQDGSFTSTEYLPGTSGEARMFGDIMRGSGLTNI